MLVVIIIGTLTAIAIPQLDGFRQKKYFVIESTNRHIYTYLLEEIIMTNKKNLKSKILYQKQAQVQKRPVLR